MEREEQIRILHEAYEFRNIKREEAEQTVIIEEICFPPNEACSRKMMLERVAAAPECFIVAVDKTIGKIAGFLNGLSTEETVFRDEFFTDAGLYDPNGKIVMLLGLDVLPQYRHQGLAREIVRQYVLWARENGKELLILTCLDEKVHMYEKMGFCDKGISGSKWGGEKWHEMTYRIEKR